MNAHLAELPKTFPSSVILIKASSDPLDWTSTVIEEVNI